MIAAALVLEAAFRLLARRSSVIVVGPELARRYRDARAPARDHGLAGRRRATWSRPRRPTARSYDGELRLIAVGRLDAEKNPLLIADVLRSLVDGGRPWRLLVCGDGVAARSSSPTGLRELGVEERAELPGYVPYGPRLLELYRASHALLHASWTEGLPQVLIEAFAAGVPRVATDVGGHPRRRRRRGVPGRPGRAGAAAAELESIAADGELRRRLIVAGNRYVAPRTAGAEVSRVAEFLRG